MQRLEASGATQMRHHPHLCGILLCKALANSLHCTQVLANASGLMIAVAAIWCAAVYNIWVGSKTKALGLGSLQLMWLYAPQVGECICPTKCLGLALTFLASSLWAHALMRRAWASCLLLSF